MLVQDKKTGTWTIPCGFAKKGEHRNKSAAKELFEETNGAFSISEKEINFGMKPGQFQNYIEMTYGNPVHTNTTFIVKTSSVNNLMAIAKKMKSAPKKSGYQETTGVAIVDLNDLINASKNRTNVVKVLDGFTFIYGNNKIITSNKNQNITLRNALAISLNKNDQNFLTKAKNAFGLKVMAKHI